MFATEKTLELKRRKGSIGACDELSIRRNRNSRSAPPNNANQTNGVRNPIRADSTKPNVIPPKPSVEVTAPLTSKPGPAAFGRSSGTNLRVNAAVASAIGTLMKKAHRQE